MSRSLSVSPPPRKSTSVSGPPKATPASGHGCPAKMTAAVWTAPGRFELRDTPLPQPEAGQVRVRLEGCGVSAHEFALWEKSAAHPLDPHAPSPGAPGREAWGRIDALGAGVQNFLEGERVAFLTEQGYAQYAVANVQDLLRLPPGLDNEPFPAGSLGGAVNLFRRSCINKGDTVAVVGIGFLGALVTQLAVLSEARVIAVGRRPCSLDLARRFGAAHALPFDPLETPRQVRELTSGALCDIVIEASGKPPALDLAAELTRERGKLMIGGYHHTPRAVNLPLWNRRGMDVINAHEPSHALCLEGMREAVAVVDAGLITPQPLYTHRFPMERLSEALCLAAERPEGFIKAIIEITSHSTPLRK